MTDGVYQLQQKPRLFLAGTFLSIGGGHRSVIEDLAERFQQTGHFLVVASPYRIGLVRGAHMLITAILRRRQYDLAVVDLFSGRAFLWGEALSILLKTLGCSFIFVLRGGSLPDFARSHPKRVRSCLERATVVIGLSSYLVKQMRPYSDNLQLLPNPLDVANYPFRLRRTLHPQLVWLRAFHEIYNPTLALRVLKRLIQDYPDLHLTMVGPDKGDGTLQEVQQMAAELGIADRINLPGGVPKAEVPVWMNKGEIFINTTNADNTPISVLEAMACGLCVVSTNVGGIPYLLEDGQDALLVPPDDSEAMADAVRRILAEPGLAERLSYNARQKVASFDWSVILPQWEQLLLTVAAEGVS